MWTRGAANKKTGLMQVVVTDWNGVEFFHGEFDNLADAEKAGQEAERRMTLEMTAPKMTLDDVLSEMSDNDLLAELLS